MCVSVYLDVFMFCLAYCLYLHAFNVPGLFIHLKIGLTLTLIRALLSHMVNL